MRSRVLLVVLATLLATPAVGPALASEADPAIASGPSSPPTSYTAIPNQLVDLADGDRLALGSPDQKRLMSQRYDAATRSWSGPTLVFVRKNLYCGALDVISSPTGAVAVTLQCDEGGYAEDTAPTGSRALYSPDATTWVAHPLPGEAYEEPGISPAGSYAVWPLGRGEYVTYHQGSFTEGRVRAQGQEYTETAVVADDGAVSYVYGGTLPGSRRCGLVVLTRTRSGPVASEAVPVEDACGDYGLTNLDAHTVVLGDPGWDAYATTLTRPGPGTPFANTRRPPATAPGLVRYPRNQRRAIAPRFLTAPGLPMVAVGSKDRRRVQVQTYLADQQVWSAPQEIFKNPVPGCSLGDVMDGLGLLVVDLACYTRKRDSYPIRNRAKGHRTLVSGDGVTWHVLRRGTRPLGISPDGQYVATGDRTGTTVISRERGLVRLPLAVRGACEVVVPGGPDSAMRLAALRRSDRGWPTGLFASTPDGWRLDQRVKVQKRGTCRRVYPPYGEPFSYQFTSRRWNAILTPRLVAGGWDVQTR